MCARRGYYWISDIADVEAKIKELKADPGSSKRLAEFRTERKKLVEDLTKVGADLGAVSYSSDMFIFRALGNMKNGPTLMFERKRVNHNVG